jgi:F0F1-type ATP synthase membrane subunit c/vacuolar-type H+-ATPase subunit K
MKIIRNCILLSAFFFLIFLLTPNIIFAQSTTTSTITTPSSDEVKGAATLGVAKIVEVEGDIKDGNIISASKKKAILSNIPYDSQVLGVVSRDAAIVLNASGSNKGVPVISIGTVYVLVSTQNGVIKKGDQITTSTIPGVGMKADKEGYIIGNALEDDTNPNPKQIDKIAVDLELHYFNTRPTLSGSLTDILKLAFMPTKEGPAPIFKYIVAAGVVVASFILGFLSFGRTAAKGVEALGRNPAASKIINLGIIFNVAIVVAIVLSGLIVAFLILRL